MDGSTVTGLVLGAAPLLLPAVPGVAVALEPASRGAVGRFALTYRVPVTLENGRYLRARLGHGRRHRALGWALGWGLGVAVDLSVVRGPALGDQDYSYTWAFSLAFAGYLIGGAAAQFTGTSTPQGPRRAVLSERRPAGYVTRAARRSPFALAAVAAVLALGLLARRQVPTAGDLGPIALGLSCAALIWFTQRQVAGRAQPITAPGLLAVDDAVRARDAQRVTGAGAAVACLALAAGVESSLLPPGLQDSAGTISAVLTLLGLAAWFRMRTARSGPDTGARA